jgi:hypothetical protein
MKMLKNQLAFIALLVTSQAVFAMNRYPGAKKADVPNFELTESAAAASKRWKESQIAEYQEDFDSQIEDLLSNLNAVNNMPIERRRGETLAERLNAYQTALAETRPIDTALRELMLEKGYRLSSNMKNQLRDAFRQARANYQAWFNREQVQEGSRLKLIQNPTIATQDSLAAINRDLQALEALFVAVGIGL